MPTGWAWVLKTRENATAALRFDSGPLRRHRNRVGLYTIAITCDPLGSA